MRVARRSPQCAPAVSGEAVESVSTCSNPMMLGDNVQIILPVMSDPTVNTSDAIARRSGRVASRRYGSENDTGLKVKRLVAAGGTLPSRVRAPDRVTASTVRSVGSARLFCTWTMTGTVGPSVRPRNEAHPATATTAARAVALSEATVNIGSSALDQPIWQTPGPGSWTQAPCPIPAARGWRAAPTHVAAGSRSPTAVRENGRLVLPRYCPL